MNEDEIRKAFEVTGYSEEYFSAFRAGVIAKTQWPYRYAESILPHTDYRNHFSGPLPASMAGVASGDISFSDPDEQMPVRTTITDQNGIVRRIRFDFGDY